MRICYQVIHRDHDAAVHALATHPFMYVDGFLFVYNSRTSLIRPPYCLSHCSNRPVCPEVLGSINVIRLFSLCLLHLLIVLLI